MKGSICITFVNCTNHVSSGLELRYFLSEGETGERGESECTCVWVCYGTGSRLMPKKHS